MISDSSTSPSSAEVILTSSSCSSSSFHCSSASIGDDDLEEEAFKVLEDAKELVDDLEEVEFFDDPEVADDFDDADEVEVLDDPEEVESFEDAEEVEVFDDPKEAEDFDDAEEVEVFDEEVEALDDNEEDLDIPGAEEILNGLGAEAFDDSGVDVLNVDVFDDPDVFDDGVPGLVAVADLASLEALVDVEDPDEFKRDDDTLFLDDGREDDADINFFVACDDGAGEALADDFADFGVLVEAGIYR